MRKHTNNSPFGEEILITSAIVAIAAMGAALNVMKATEHLIRWIRYHSGSKTPTIQKTVGPSSYGGSE